MAIGYRMVMESFDLEEPNKVISSKEVIQGETAVPTNCLDFSLDYPKQVLLLKRSLDFILSEKINQISQNKECPKCSGSLIKKGIDVSVFCDVLTDHKIEIPRKRCTKCGYESPSTVRALINTSMSGYLTKIQAELGATNSFRESEKILDTFSASSRKINNRNRIKNITDDVGNALAATDLQEKEMAQIAEAKELILNVDGGHVKTIEDKRSIEAITSVIYRPEALNSKHGMTKNYIEKKSCAASVKNDEQKEIISGTILSAIKEGLTPNTIITALCDGAVNCWKVVDALKPLCKEVHCILDWFHIAMKIENISIPEEHKEKLEKIKWHLWHGNAEKAIERLDFLISLDALKKSESKLVRFKKYIENNLNRMVNYMERKSNGLVFTSNLAESTVESLINRRCKGQQHMRWSREGLNPILQLRAKLHTNDWDNKWKTAVMHMAA